MADTNPHSVHAAPVEGDGVSYSGIVWFVVILTVTVLFCELVVWGMFEWFDYRVTRNDAPRVGARPQPASSPVIDGGRLLQRRRDHAAARRSWSTSRACCRPSATGENEALHDVRLDRSGNGARSGCRSSARRICCSNAGCRRVRRRRPPAPAATGRATQGGAMHDTMHHPRMRWLARGTVSEPVARPGVSVGVGAADRAAVGAAAGLGGDRRRLPMLRDVGIDQKLDAQVPLDAPFVDENGRDVDARATTSAGRPVVLVLAYYECPMLCTQVINADGQLDGAL